MTGWVIYTLQVLLLGDRPYVRLLIESCATEDWLQSRVMDNQRAGTDVGYIRFLWQTRAYLHFILAMAHL